MLLLISLTLILPSLSYSEQAQTAPASVSPLPRAQSSQHAPCFKSDTPFTDAQIDQISHVLDAIGKSKPKEQVKALAEGCGNQAVKILQGADLILNNPAAAKNVKENVTSQDAQDLFSEVGDATEQAKNSAAFAKIPQGSPFGDATLGLDGVTPFTGGVQGRMTAPPPAHRSSDPRRAFFQSIGQELEFHDKAGNKRLLYAWIADKPSGTQILKLSEVLEGTILSHEFPLQTEKWIHKPWEGGFRISVRLGTDRNTLFIASENLNAPRPNPKAPPYVSYKKSDLAAKRAEEAKKGKIFRGQAYNYLIQPMGYTYMLALFRPGNFSAATIVCEKGIPCTLGDGKSWIYQQTTQGIRLDPAPEKAKVGEGEGEDEEKRKKPGKDDVDKDSEGWPKTEGFLLTNLTTGEQYEVKSTLLEPKGHHANLSWRLYEGEDNEGKHLRLRKFKTKYSAKLAMNPPYGETENTIEILSTGSDTALVRIEQKEKGKTHLRILDPQLTEVDSENHLLIHPRWLMVGSVSDTNSHGESKKTRVFTVHQLNPVALAVALKEVGLQEEEIAKIRAAIDNKLKTTGGKFEMLHVDPDESGTIKLGYKQGKQDKADIIYEFGKGVTDKAAKAEPSGEGAGAGTSTTAETGPGKGKGKPGKKEYLLGGTSQRPCKNCELYAQTTSGGKKVYRFGFSMMGPTGPQPYPFQEGSGSSNIIPYGVIQEAGGINAFLEKYEFSAPSETIPDWDIGKVDFWCDQRVLGIFSTKGKGEKLLHALVKPKGWENGWWRRNIFYKGTQACSAIEEGSQPTPAPAAPSTKPPHFRGGPN